ncbi:hypothetical protein HOLleu_42371 [Holothuria leucospilota]|uniref:Uncharacterized protein n=1 Tax=Holothuria leucospilota TaxID=206669 RepID=A0A9Q0YEY1_HOLLE|nr:hypothetical protein HOLleu_42371 [Holothuria leucospilota]
MEEEYEDVAEDTLSQFTDTLDAAIEKITKELKKIRSDFSRAIAEQKKAIEAVKAENVQLKEKCHALETRISGLEKSREEHSALHNKHERFSRRNNIRIVGFLTGSQENCLQIAKDVIAKVGIPDCHLERAHRDGRKINGRDSHILVKLTFFQDKVFVMKNARQALTNEGYYIVEDLTKIDLAEKRRHSRQVSELFQQGVRLRYSGGLWRHGLGGDLNFVFNLDLDKKGGNRRTNFKAREKCLDLMGAYDLVDVWRDKNRCVKNFTWSSNIIPGIHCRLD